jgi:hypothetical protein
VLAAVVRAEPDWSRLPAGEPFAIADRIALDGTVSLAGLTASDSGAFAYRSGESRGSRQLTWVDRGGNAVGDVGQADNAAIFNPDLSEDERLVAINRTVDVNMDVWLMDVSHGVQRRFTFDAGTEQLPVFTPDGRHVIFSSNRKNIFDLYIKPVSGPGAEAVLLETAENKFPMSVSRDGRFLLYRNTEPNVNWDLWALPLAPPGAPISITRTPFQEMIGEFSPDGRWVAYQSNESGRVEVYVQSFPESTARADLGRRRGAAALAPGRQGAVLRGARRAADGRACERGRTRPVPVGSTCATVPDAHGRRPGAEPSEAPVRRISGRLAFPAQSHERRQRPPADHPGVELDWRPPRPVTARDKAMDVERPWAEPRLAKVPPVGKLRFVFPNEFVSGRLEGSNPLFGHGWRRDTNHHIDDWLRPQAGDCRAPDVLDHRSGSREQLGEDPTFLLEPARPFRIIGDQQHVIHHRSVLRFRFRPRAAAGLRGGPMADFAGRR